MDVLAWLGALSTLVVCFLGGMGCSSVGETTFECLHLVRRAEKLHAPPVSRQLRSLGNIFSVITHRHHTFHDWSLAMPLLNIT